MESDAFFSQNHPEGLITSETYAFNHRWTLMAHLGGVESGVGHEQMPNHLVDDPVMMTSSREEKRFRRVDP